MFVTTGALVVTTALLLWWLLKPSKYHRMLAKIPGPTPIPILGNTLQLKPDPEGFFSQLKGYCYEYEKTSPAFKLMVGNDCFVFIYTAATAEIYFQQFLGSMKNLTKADAYRFMHPWLQTGLLTSTGHKWQSRRKLLTPTFHFRILTDFLEVFNEQGQVLVSLLEDKCGGDAFDVFPYITHCALDIICETAMGKKIDAQRTGGNSDYVEAIYTMSDLVIVRARSPWQWIDSIYNLTSRGKTHAACLKTLHSFTKKVIKERIEEMEEDPDKFNSNPGDSGIGKRRLAFLDLLIHMSKEADFTQNDIQEEVDTFMFEGHDTTAAAMVWAVHLIGTHPDVQQRLHREMDDIFGGSDRPSSMADISNMKYLECVIKESLRLYPSVIQMGRRIEEDTEIGGVMIPEGASLNVFIWKINRDPACWPDPNTFNPDRFNSANSAGRHPYAFIPFSAGPRNCIGYQVLAKPGFLDTATTVGVLICEDGWGQKFALIEEKCVLAAILRNFSIKSMQKSEDTQPVPELILRPLNGITVKLTKRST